MVLEKVTVPLPDLYRHAFPGSKYQATKARDCIMRLPLAFALVRQPGTQTQYVVFARTEGVSAFAASLRRLAEQRQTRVFPRATVKMLQQLATTVADKQRVMYAVVEAQGFSANKAKQHYGFTGYSAAKSAMEEKLAACNELVKQFDELCAIEDNVICENLGLEPLHGETTDPSESDWDEGDDDDDTFWRAAGEGDDDDDTFWRASGGFAKECNIDLDSCDAQHDAPR